MIGGAPREARERLRDEIITARKELGMTQYALGKEVGIPTSGVVRFEDNRFGPPAHVTKNLLAITDGLGIDPLDFGYDPAAIDRKRMELERVEQRRLKLGPGRYRLHKYPHEAFGAEMAAARKAKELSQHALAELIQVADGTVAAWEVGMKIPGIEKIKTWAAGLGEDAAEWVKKRAHAYAVGVGKEV